jgi:hypothetical protein
LDIHKSKLAVVKYHSSKKGKTYVCLVFSTRQTKHHVKKSSWRELNSRIKMKNQTL